MNHPSRRCFLKIVGVGSALGGVACSSAPASPESFGDVPSGNVSSVSVGALQAVPGAPAILGRDENGLYAMTATCTHEGCDMIHNGTITSTGAYCDCHGSRFDVNGNPTAGPASTALQHFAVSLDASGEITVHGGSPVAQSVRTAVSA